MEPIIALLVAVLFSGSIYLILSRHTIRILLGIGLLGNAVNLLIFTSGRLTRTVPPFIEEGAKTAAAGIANPLPQALILTAIVIGFSLFAFILVLVYKSFQRIGTDNASEMRLAEPVDDGRPPQGY